MAAAEGEEWRQEDLQGLGGGPMPGPVAKPFIKSRKWKKCTERFKTTQRRRNRGRGESSSEVILVWVWDREETRKGERKRKFQQPCVW
jgi:hypothetical protein